MRNIYIVTHPEATHHRSHLVGGWFDSDLTDRGRVQAQAIAEALAGRIPEGMTLEVRSSDLRRARTTADVVARRLNTGVHVDVDLREKSYGEADGKPQAWLDERFVPAPEFGERLRHDEGIAGAETRWDLATRAYAAMDRIQRSAADSVVAVTHGGTSTFLLAAWIGMPIEATGLVSFGFTSGGISVLRKDNRHHGHQISTLNDVRHLHGY